MSEHPGQPGSRKRPHSKPSSKRVGDQTVTLPSEVIRPAELHKEHPGLVVIQGREIGREYRLRRRKSVLGRGEEVTLRIPDDLVSRRHASLEVAWDPDSRLQRVFLTDLKSTNRSYVNGDPVERVELQEGDKVRVGKTVLKFVLQDELDARFHEEIRNRIAYDQLTGLLTKESLFEALTAELKRCARYELPLAVLMMDLDRFKQVNDTRGHIMGSQVLARVGRLIRRGLRRTDVSGRYGGEEFVAYLQEASAGEALRAAERVRTVIEAHPFTRVGETGGSQALRITISIGVSQFPRHGETLEALVAAADAALYRAKAEGRNRICLA